MAESRLAPLLTLLNAPMVAAYTAAGFWGDETIYHLAARHARTMPHAYAVRDRRRRLSVPEVKARYITWLASPLASASSAGPGNSPNGVASAGPTCQVQRPSLARHSPTFGRNG